MITSTVPLSIDGVNLNTLAFNIKSLSGRLGMPARKGENSERMGHGRGWRPKFFDQNNLVLQMWVRGCDGDGVAPAPGDPTYQMFRENLDMLYGLFGKTHDLLDVRQSWPQGVRQAFCEVTQVIDPEVFGVSPTGQFSVQLVNPGAFWQDIAPTDFNSGSLGGNTDLSLTPYIGATAPMMDMLYLVKGPGANPKLIDSLSGHQIQLNYTLAAGENWRLDPKNGLSVTGANLDFTAGGVSRIVDTTFSGPHSPAMMGLTPGPVDTAPVLRFEATGGFAAGTSVSTRGRRKYL